MPADTRAGSNIPLTKVGTGSPSDRWEVLQISKNELKIRPIYHRLSPRIEANITSIMSTHIAHISKTTQANTTFKALTKSNFFHSL